MGEALQQFLRVSVCVSSRSWFVGGKNLGSQGVLALFPDLCAAAVAATIPILVANVIPIIIVKTAIVTLGERSADLPQQYFKHKEMHCEKY